VVSRRRICRSVRDYTRAFRCSNASLRNWVKLFTVYYADLSPQARVSIKESLPRERVPFRTISKLLWSGSFVIQIAMAVLNLRTLKLATDGADGTVNRMATLISFENVPPAIGQ
jgi:hypothetical protein